MKQQNKLWSCRVKITFELIPCSTCTCTTLVLVYTLTQSQ